MTDLLGGGLIEWRKDGVVLTAEQKRFYERNGYVVLRNVVPQSEINRYNDRFNYICNADRAEFPSMTIMRDVTLAKTPGTRDVREVTKIQHWQDDPVLFDYCKHPAIVDVVRDLIGTRGCNLVSLHNMIINKPPDSGSLTSRHPLHQDTHYFPIRPADFVCVSWTAMQTINRANGCLVVVPGTHKGPLLPHVYPDWGANNMQYLGIQDYDPSTPRTYVEMEAGDTIFFHPNIIHGSGANKTKSYRRAISSHYANDTEGRYNYDLTEGQKETAKDVVAMWKAMLKRSGKWTSEAEKIDYIGVLKAKSKAVTGTKTHL